MYICVFSRSEGAGRATVRNTRGLTRSVIALMVPPLPAASRPSKTMTTRRPLAFTQSCAAHSFAWRRRSAFSYFFRFTRQPFLLDRGGQWIPLHRVGDVDDRLLRSHAVAGVVERRGDHR